MNLSNFQYGLLSLAIAGCAFALAALQSLMGASVGTDHPVHAFLIRAIRNNHRRFFVRIPRLLNEAYCAALPLYIHWLLSYFRSSAMHWAERLLNPTVNALHVLVFSAIAAWAASRLGLDSSHAVATTGLFALTPQFFHALSARNFGLSARGTGLLLLSIFLFSVYWVEASQDPMLGWAVLIASACMIWAFSTFGAQALVIISVLLLIVSGRLTPLIGTALGLLAFIAIHPRYSFGYLRHTLRFIKTYATQLAPIYILNRRYSIWRDLVWDIWVSVKASPRKGFRYAYENSVLITVFLNPLLALALIGHWSSLKTGQGIYTFASDVALCGTIAALLTSFRPTRFLGEPERYVEAVTPWATLAGGHVIAAQFGIGVLFTLIAAFLAINALQLFATNVLVNYIQAKPVRLDAAETAIGQARPSGVRCCSNNEQLTKLLMQNDWDFSYCIAVGQDYCGMRVDEAFSTFPYLRRDACERILHRYRINVCVLDRTLYDTVFDARPAELVQMSTIYESEGLRVLALEWAADAVR